jgi:hypothetical protein
MTDREVLIERLATTCLGLDAVDPLRLLVDDVVAALRGPEQEPVVGTKTWFEDGKVVTKYLHPSDIYIDSPQRTWVGLTGEDVAKAYDDYQSGRFSAGFMGAIRSIEAKLKEKNT